MTEKNLFIDEKKNNTISHDLSHNKKQTKISLISDEKPTKNPKDPVDEKNLYIKSSDDFNGFLKDSIDFFKHKDSFKTKNEGIENVYSLLKKEQKKNEDLQEQLNILEEKYRKYKQKNTESKNSEFYQNYMYLKEKYDDLAHENNELISENKRLENSVRKYERYST